MIVTKEESLSNADIATNTEQFILVNSPEFLKALRKVVNATAGEECPHPILQYVHVRIESDCLIIEACDSLVLDLLTVSASVDPELIGKDFLISKSFAKSLVKTPHKYGSRLSIRPSFNANYYTGKLVVIANGNEFIDHIDDPKVNNLNYPKLDDVIPRTMSKTLTMEIRAEDLLPVLKEQEKDFKGQRGMRPIRIGIKGKQAYLITKDHRAGLFPIEIAPKNAHIDIDDQKMANKVGLDFFIDVDWKKLVKELKYLNKHDSLLFSFEGTLRPLKIINQRTDGVSIIVPIRTFAN